MHNGDNPRVFHPYDNSGINMKAAETISNVGFEITKGFVKNIINDETKGITDLFSLKFLKPYFSVDNKYVSMKLKLILFPFLYNESKSLNEEIEFEQDDTNNDKNQNISKSSIAFPDLYVPLMGFITFLLVIALSLGTDNQ